MYVTNKIKIIILRTFGSSVFFFFFLDFFSAYFNSGKGFCIRTKIVGRTGFYEVIAVDYIIYMADFSSSQIFYKWFWMRLHAGAIRWSRRNDCFPDQLKSIEFWECLEWLYRIQKPYVVLSFKLPSGVWTEPSEDKWIRYDQYLGCQSCKKEIKITIMLIWKYDIQFLSIKNKTGIIRICFCFYTCGTSKEIRHKHAFYSFCWGHK